ncbi:MAG: hypothetical protein HHJ12_00015 [Glaciimonas sp.]|nr:hypothetical protein [Glaciimonas sp.]
MLVQAPRRARFLTTGILALVLSVLCACESKIIPLTEQEKQHMTTFTEHMTTRCLGRYLVDLPASFILNPIQRIEIEGVEIQIEPMTKLQFSMMLKDRATGLANTTIGVRPEYPMLQETYPISGNDDLGSVFNRAESDSNGSRGGRMLELHAWKNGYAITANVKATDTRFPEYAGDKGIQAMEIDVPEKLALLLAVYQRTQGRADTEVPNGQGVCFPNGLVRGPATDQEHLDISYYLGGAPDVSFEFHSLSDIGPEDTELLDRGAAIEGSLKAKHGYTLRKGHVRGQLEGAQEWLIGYKPLDEIAYQSFTLEANSKTGSAMAPLIVLDFGVGSRIPEAPLSLEEVAVRKPLSKATLSESEAIALWDVVVPTLRPRPGAF